MRLRFFVSLLCCLLVGSFLAACALGGGTGQSNAPILSPTGGGGNQMSTPTANSLHSAGEMRQVIIDTDMAVDDWMAILYLLHRPDVNVAAITVAGTGEAHCAAGVRNALKLVALAEHAPIPVACGRETPLQGNHVFPQGWRDFVDSLAGISLADGSNPNTDMNAVQLLTQILQASPAKVDLLTLGPLTNPAEAFQATPGLVNSIEAVTIMGGAVNVLGNVGSDVPGNTAAEWNIYIDPHAANIVLASGISVTLVGLDATNHAILTMDFLQQLQSAQLTPTSVFIYSVLSQMRAMIRSESYYFWDPLAAGILVDESLATYQDYSLCVVEEEGPESGRTVVRDGCPSTRVAVSADRVRFEQQFLETLNSPFAEDTGGLSLSTGAWTGTARNGDFEMEVTVSVSEVCQPGAVCAHFDIPSLPCSGDFSFVGMTEGMYQFQAVNQQGTCGAGQDFLQPQADGTLIYVSKGDYGETRGILQEVHP